MNVTDGRILNCAIAKAVGLCHKDPVTAQRLCGKSCGIGCKCRDNNKAMKTSTGGLTCAQVVQHGMCSLLNQAQGLCSCSCPCGYRRMFGTISTITTSCPFNTFDKRFNTAKSKCCAGNNCRSGVPVRCSLECSQVFPGFFASCGHAIETYD